MIVMRLGLGHELVNRGKCIEDFDKIRGDGSGGAYYFHMMSDDGVPCRTNLTRRKTWLAM